MSNPKPGPTGRRSTRKRGQAMVEFAMVLPLFMLVLSGICDFGFMLYQRMTVISAAREGARAASIVESAAGSRVGDAANAAATGAALNGGVSGVSVPAPVCYATHVDPGSTTPITCSTAVNGDSVAVEVDYTYHTFFPLAFGSTINLSSTVQMVFDNLP